MASAGPIICGVEDTSEARHAAAAAGWLATALEAPLLIAHVFDPGAIPVLPQREMDEAAVTDEDLERAARERAHLLVSELAAALGGEVETEVADDMPVAGLLGLASARGARLAVVGTEARAGLEGVLIESVARRFVADAPCPVAVVPPGAELEGTGPVVAGYDGSEDSRRAARHGAALAARLGRDFALVQATGGPEDLAAPDPQLDATPEAVEGDPVRALAQLGRERSAPFIVAGTRGRSALSSALLGSVSDGLVRNAGRPVVLVPASAGEAP